MRFSRAGFMSTLAMGLAMGPLPSAPRGWGRRALRAYFRSAHPRSQAYRVGAWAGDGVPSAMGVAGVTRQMVRAHERRKEKSAR